MIQEIHAVRDRFEKSAFERQPKLEAEALALWNKGDQKGARELLTRYSDNNANAVLADWWKLSTNLYLKYNDGYLNTQKTIADPVFYPAWWLKQVGYENGPTSYEKKPVGK
jgi:dipeptidase